AGSRVTRVFVGDAEGKLWRADFSDPDPVNWTIAEFFDPTDVHFTSGEVIEPVFEAPVVAKRPDGRLAVIYGNGDIDNLLDQTATGNFVASLTESYDVSFNVTANVNWFKALGTAEKLTGSPIVYNSVAYFPTFARGA